MIVLTLVLPWPAFADATGAPGDVITSAAGARTLSVSNACPNATLTVVNCDTSPPVLTLPGNTAVEATNSSGATVSFTASARDANPVVPIMSCTPASGSTFPVGVTVVTCSATGASGLTANASFIVSVQDTRPPTISKPADLTLEATGQNGAPVTYLRPTASDAGGPANPTVTCTPGSGSTFPIGTTPVTCSATDAAGNTASTTFNIIVVNPTTPSQTPPADQPVQADDPSG
jgi:hypothetical protein